MSRLLQPLVPGLDVKPLIAELRERMEEELDYRDEAAQPARVRRGVRGDPAIAVPRVVASAPQRDGHRVGQRQEAVARSSAGGTATERDQAGALLAEFHYSRARAGRAAARRPAPGQLPAAARRPACWCSTSARWPGCPTACPAAVRDDPARAGGRPTTWSPCCATRGSCCRRSAVTGADADRLPRAVRRAAAHRDRSTSPGAGCRARPSGSATCAARASTRQAAEPAAAVPADPPGDDGDARSAVPARRPGPAARHRPEVEPRDVRRRLAEVAARAGPAPGGVVRPVRGEMSEGLRQ